MAQIFEGPSEAEAAIKACEALGVSRSQLAYSIVSREEGPPKRVVIEVQSDEGDRQPTHLADEYSRMHGGSHGRRHDNAGGQKHRGGGGGRSGGNGPRSRGGRHDRQQGRGRPSEQDEFDDRLAEEYKEFREMTAAPKEPVPPKPALPEAQLSERAKRSLEVTRELLSLASLDAAVQISHDDSEQVLVDIHGPDEGLIIGRKGEMLLALQFMVNRVIGKESEGPERIAVDCEGYRERRQQALRVLALKLGEKARHDGKIVTVSPMNAHDRRIFHVTLDGQEGLKTRSEGDGLFRRVMIIPDGAEA